MSSREQAPSVPNYPALLLPVYGAAIFLSAALLFAVQPMFTKMVLPRLGGSPSVWSVAMVFFQALLLAGYAYAHLLTRVLAARIAVMVQVAVMIAALFALPLAIAAGWGRPPEFGEAFWLIGLFTASIGLPFFALSANGPLLQAWFARTDHPAAKNPYFLYAASNIGSFLALISYPIAIEPFIHLGDQTRGWSAGFVILIALVAASGAMLWFAPNAQPGEASAEDEAAARPTFRDALSWMALAAVPSGLLVAVTAHISTDVAAVPLLWVVPLALYLLTFVIVFSTRPVIPHRYAVLVQPFVIAALIAVLVLDLLDSILIQVALHIAAFFISALVCHGELARRRPAPRHLTAFYMWMSAGGMIGGLAAGLIAPHVFNWVAEYPILIVLALLCRPGIALPAGRSRNIAFGIVLAAAALLAAASIFSDQVTDTVKAVVVTVLLVPALFWRQQPLLLAAAVAFILAGNRLSGGDAEGETVRSFFGVHKISDSDDGDFRILMHGTTIHGAERISDIDDDTDGKPETLTYYHDGSGIAQAINAARERAGRPINFAVIGLGTGTLACRAEPGDTLTYYEIDPAVGRIASDADQFTFLSKCRPDVPIKLGDARLTLADARDGVYDLIIVDAFSSDAIPIHLLTREAMALYLQKLAPHGMVVLHLSNRHLELTSVAAGIAGANGLIARICDDCDTGADDDENRYNSTVAAVVREEADFGPLAKGDDWEVKQPDPKQWVWTDDYSNIPGAVMRKLKGK